MKKKIAGVLIAAIVSLGVAGCHKICTCSGYDGLEYEFTSDEVDSLASGSCNNMVYRAGIQYYSYCTWK